MTFGNLKIYEGIGLLELALKESLK